MGDRIRLGEVLAAIGAVGLTVMLIAGTWLQYATADVPVKGIAPGALTEPGGENVLGLGWFVTVLLALAAIGGLAFIFRVLTAKDTERPMLQAPLAYAAAVIATPVLLLRLTAFVPNVEQITVDDAQGKSIALAGPFPTEVAGGGWIGLLFLFLILIGTWFAMADERTGTAAAKAQTEALLAGVQTRPVPQPVAVPSSKAPSAQEADAAASAEGELPTEDDPKTPAPQEKP